MQPVDLYKVGGELLKSLCLWQDCERTSSRGCRCCTYYFAFASYKLLLQSRETFGSNITAGTRVVLILTGCRRAIQDIRWEEVGAQRI